MAVQELNSGQLFSLNAGVGFSAPRQWACDTYAEVLAMIRALAAPTHHFPNLGAGAANAYNGWDDMIVVAIEVNPFNRTMAPGTTSGGTTISGVVGATIDAMPSYTKYLITAHYQLVMNAGSQALAEWPPNIERPKIPTHSCISLRIKNSGQVLVMASENGKYVADDYIAGDEPVGPLNEKVSANVVIPLRQFQITVDRMFHYQVPDFSQYAGAVNESMFLNSPPETLLFETAEVDHSFAPDIDNLYRYRCTVVLTERAIHRRIMAPNPPGVDPVSAFGWNHDYYNADDSFGGPGFFRVLLTDDEPRYRLVDMKNMFIINPDPDPEP